MTHYNCCKNLNSDPKFIQKSWYCKHCSKRFYEFIIDFSKEIIRIRNKFKYAGYPIRYINSPITFLLVTLSKSKIFPSLFGIIWSNILCSGYFFMTSMTRIMAGLPCSDFINESMPYILPPNGPIFSCHQASR